MIKHEAVWTTSWMRWARANKKLLPIAAAIEIKVTLDKSIPFSAVQDHQINALQIAKWQAYCYKLSDAARVEMPNDVIWMRDAAGLLVIYFKYKVGRGWNKEFFIIDVDCFVRETEDSKRKSLTEERAREIAMLVGRLN